MSKTSASETYCSLYTFVKKHNADLYNILEDMCAIGLFRPRYPVTFLNPGSDLTKKLTAMVEKGHSEEAFEKLQSLFVFGKHNSIKEDAVTYNRKNYSDVGVFKGLAENKHYAPWKNRTSEVSVLDFNKKDFPVEGAEASPVLAKRKSKAVGKGKKGGNTKKNDSDSDSSDSDSEDDEEDIRTTATKKIIKEISKKNVQKVFIHAVDSLLDFMSDKSNYDAIKMKVDPNMVLTWFILVKPNSTIENELISDSDFASWYNGYKEKMHMVDSDFNTIKEIFKSGAPSDKLRMVGDERKKIDTAGFSNTIKSVKNAYKNDLAELLEDELRFRFSNDLDMSAVEILPMLNLNWEDPKESLVLFKEPSASCLYKPQLHELMCEFVKSNAFKYTIIKEDLYDRLLHNTGISGGAVSGKKIINVLGGAHRNTIKTMKQKNTFGRFVKSLSTKQIKELKSALERL